MYSFTSVSFFMTRVSYGGFDACHGRVCIGSPSRSRPCLLLTRGEPRSCLPPPQCLLPRQLSCAPRLISNFRSSHSRHRSPTNFLVNVLAGVLAYCHQPKKPSLQVTPEVLAVMSQ